MRYTNIIIVTPASIHRHYSLSDFGRISLRQSDIHYLSNRPLPAVGCDHHRPEPGVVEGDRRRGRAVEEVERHPVPPDRRSTLYDDEGPSGDLREGRQRLGGGDGGGDADGVDDGGG